MCVFYYARRSAHIHLEYSVSSELYTLSLHDALPIYTASRAKASSCSFRCATAERLRWRRRHEPFIVRAMERRDRKSTRLNSSHVENSYAVFCLKKKNSSGNQFRRSNC